MTKWLLQIGVSLALIAALAWWVDIGELASTLTGADPVWLVIALVIATANRVLMAVKWELLLAARGIVMTSWQVIRIYYQSTFLGVFLPPTVGGDAVRVWLVRRMGFGLADIISSVVVERALGLLVLAMFGVAAAALFPLIVSSDAVSGGQLFAVVASAGILAVLLFVFSFTATAEQIVLRVCVRLERIAVMARLARFLNEIYASYRDYRHDRAVLTGFFLLTILENMLPIVRAWIVAHALGVSLSLWWFCLIVPLEQLLIRIPLSFDGFGIREGLFVWFLLYAGVPESTGFAVGLTNHVLFLVALLPGGILCAMDPGVRRRTGQA